MIVCRLDRVSRHYSTETIFRDLSCQIEMGDRIGLVGPNGVGKTTLLKLIVGEDQPDTGTVIRHPGSVVAYLAQHRELEPGRTLVEEVRLAMAHLEHWYEEMVAAGAAMAEAATDAERAEAAHVYDDRQELLRQHGGFDFEHRIEDVLFGLGFTRDQFDRDVATFSGGQQSRALLARLLLQSPDLMLLDEPTNHLDIQTTEWLEEYIARQSIAMIIVSHDRYFLDRTVNKIFEMQSGKLTVYPGNYEQYRTLRAERQKVGERQATRQGEEIARLEEFVRRNKAGQLSKQAKSREKMIDRLSSREIEQIRDVNGPPMTFGAAATRTGDIVLSALDLSKSFDHTLFTGVNVEIQRGWKVGVIGPNGAGKTTLVRMLLGEEPPSSGKARLGHNVRLGYLRQEVDDLDPKETCLDAVRPAWRRGDKEEAFRIILARFGINGDLAENSIGSLSGGQRTRVALAKICAHDVNLLVLDEPTNHLDLWAVDALEEALSAFEGTVLVVSHDRSFLNTVCDRLLIIENQRVQTFNGNYDRFAESRREKERAAAAAARKANGASSKGIERVETKTTSRKNEKGKAKPKRKFPFRKAEEIEADVHRHEADIARLSESLQDPAVYADGRRLAEVTREIEMLRAELEQLVEHWSEAMELNS